MSDNNWIKTEEILPEPRVEVLVTTRFGFLQIAYYEPENGWHIASNNDLFELNPIAWQPLPALYNRYV